MPTSAAHIRQAFLDYFASHNHTIVKSSPLIPANDPTLMFTNAGMVQFKDVFTGQEARPYKRATTSQKCLRVSGKHNDLEEVGRTTRHHTLFEMLGNFSFGDYFKEEAIYWAWELLTKEMQLPPDRLWVTVFEGTPDFAADDEATKLWQKISGLPKERIIGMGMKDNFWAMGDTGPCGPCTEIHYDTGGETAPSLEDFESGRVVEIWNNVFMQFERHADGTVTPLPKPCVDTGMGLERLVTVLNGAKSNYHTDLFMPLIEKTAGLSDKTYTKSFSDDDISMQIIADHARATSFLVADGIQPSNEGRGYVLRRIMRRAIRHGRRLGFADLFFHQICDAVVDRMGAAFSELHDARALISKVAELEETTFRRTLDTGLRILGQEIQTLKSTNQKTLSGTAVFKLYDTYGFPKDLTEVIATEHGLDVDEEGFTQEMNTQKERSKGGQIGGSAVQEIYKEIAQNVETSFVGYLDEKSPLEKRDATWRHFEYQDAPYQQVECQIKAIIQDDMQIENATEGLVELVLNPTPFYGESGGQVGDTGLIIGENNLVVEVLDSQKPIDTLTVSKARILSGTCTAGQSVWAGCNPNLRQEIRAHHSATHLLHGALRKVLGEHVQQAGSLVDHRHLRFDFSHFEALTPEQIEEIETIVNTQISSGSSVTTEILDFDSAKEKGALALFGEKYGDTVRVVSMGPSIEFCGGTHIANTSNIEMLLVTREEAIASGVRRIEAEVKQSATQRAKKLFAQLNQAVHILKTSDTDSPQEETVLQGLQKSVRTQNQMVETLQKASREPTTCSFDDVETLSWPEKLNFQRACQIRNQWQGLSRIQNARVQDTHDLVLQYASWDKNNLLRKFVEMLNANKMNEEAVRKLDNASLIDQVAALAEQKQTIGEVTLIATQVPNADGKSLRTVADELRNRMGSGIFCLSATNESKVSLLIAVTDDLLPRFQAGTMIKTLAPMIGGRGGGKPQLAQAGGDTAQGLSELFTKCAELIEQG
ncbi:MAG: alanine--tRNA ligase [Myxococcota bacterium]|jgi:alanyl-tRNA synthetase|nr:alanine--tRNA ligase [Myxococcota bacterium]